MNLREKTQIYFEKIYPGVQQLRKEHHLSLASITVVEILGKRNARDKDSGLTIDQITYAQNKTFERKNIDRSAHDLAKKGYVEKEKVKRPPRKRGVAPYAHFLTSTGRELYDELVMCFVTSEKDD